MLNDTSFLHSRVQATDSLRIGRYIGSDADLEAETWAPHIYLVASSLSGRAAGWLEDEDCR